MTDVAAIILAAGLSRRMGDRNKLLLPIHGVPMIRHMVSIYQAVTQRTVVVVTGHDAQAIEQSLEGCDVRPIHNPNFAEGQQTSVACGLRAVDHAAHVFIGLGDQPYLTPQDLRSLLTAHLSSDPRRISIPKQGKQRGNPIVVPQALRALLLADPKSPGCKSFTRNHPEHTQFHSLSNPAFYTDVDTPEAYEALMTNKLEEVQ